MKRIVIKDKGIFIFKVVSILMLTSILSILTYRFIHYYRIYNAKVDTSSVNVELYQKVLNKLFTSKNVNSINNNYYVINDENDNYVFYSGRLWHIVSVNSDKTIKLVSVNNVVSLSLNKKYDESNVNKYLNKEFFETLESPDVYLTDNVVCLDNISDLEEIKCDNKEDFLVGTLSLTDYKNAGGMNSFLNNKKTFWLSNTKDDSFYYIGNDGSIKTSSVLNNFGVKATITLSKKVIYNSGNGTLQKPYIVGEVKPKILNQKNVGEYLSFSGYTWQIIEQTDLGVKIAMDGVLDTKEVFNKYGNTFADSNIFKYLNNTFYDNLENKEMIIKGIWYTGYYSPDNDYDYEKIYDSKIEANIGLLSILDPFVLDLGHTYTTTTINNYNNSVFVVNTNNDLYVNMVSSVYGVRPALYLDYNITIKDGNGTKTNPYVLEDL